MSMKVLTEIEEQGCVYVCKRGSEGEKTIPPWPKNQIVNRTMSLTVSHSPSLVYTEALWDVYSPTRTEGVICFSRNQAC